MKIINEAGLPFKVIGEIIDTIIEKTYCDTIYYGKCKYTNVFYKGKEYRVQIRYLKSFTEWRFTS